MPETLKNINNWVLYKLPSKKPYRASNGRLASPTNKAHWCEYSEAVNVYSNSDYDGIGFVFSDDNDLTFIDLDHCIDDNGEYSELAEEVLKMFKNSYIELSQSETGIHIICKGSLSRAVKTKEIEMYSTARYVAFTGNAINAVEPQNEQEHINILFNRYATPEAHLEAVLKGDISLDKSIEEIIATIEISKQSKKFNKLYYEGDYKGYLSQSEADLALMNILNYYCKGDEQAMRLIWLNSKLSERQKGIREDYIERTIKKAKTNNIGFIHSNNVKKRYRNDIKDVTKPKRRRVIIG